MSLRRLYNKTRSPLKVYWWRYDYPDKLNFGDEITQIIIKSLFGRKCVWAPPSECDMAGAGSIIEILQHLSSGNKIKIWGSGFIKPGNDITNRNLEFCAVRGKSSQSRVTNSGNIMLGDPGLLAGLAFPNVNTASKRYKLGIVPHYVDADAAIIQGYHEKKGIVVISPLWPVEKVVRTISECEFILSSSLHGLIVSDSLGVPNQWIKLSDSLTGGNYKFTDYYSVFDIMPKPIYGDLLSNIDTESLIKAYQPRIGLEDIQKNLVKAFPY